MSRAWSLCQCAECGVDLARLDVGDMPICPPCHSLFFSFVHDDREPEESGAA